MDTCSTTKHTQTDTYIHRHIDIHIDTHTHTHIHRHIDIHIDTHTDAYIHRHIDIHIDTHTHTHIHRHIDIHIDTHTHTYTYIHCCLSVAYIGPKSRTERPRKTKLGTEVAHVTRDSDITFKVKESRSQGAGHIVAASRLQLVI